MLHTFTGRPTSPPLLFSSELGDPEPPGDESDPETPGIKPPTVSGNQPTYRGDIKPPTVTDTSTSDPPTGGSGTGSGGAADSSGIGE